MALKGKAWQTPSWRKTFPPSISFVFLPDVNNCSRGCRLHRHIWAKGDKFELTVSSKGWPESRILERWHSSRKEIFSSNTAFPSMILQTENTELRPKNTRNQCHSLWRILPWLALDLQKCEKRTKFCRTSESKFPMHDAKFFHLRFLKKEKYKRLSVCSIKLAV